MMKDPLLIEPDMSDDDALTVAVMLGGKVKMDGPSVGTLMTSEILDKPETSSLASKLTWTATLAALVLKTNGAIEKLLKEGGETSAIPTWLNPKGTPSCGTGKRRFDALTLAAEKVTTLLTLSKHRTNNRRHRPRGAYIGSMI